MGIHASHNNHSKKETSMSDPVIEKIKSHPKYALLKNRRNSFGWTLSILMLVVYYGYIALIAFNKAFLAQPLGAGVTTLGIPLGMGVIVFTIVITGIYVFRANSEYDTLTKEILEDATK
jgi:uncharacterized membrane protein (DUF485 family)